MAIALTLGFALFGRSGISAQSTTTRPDQTTSAPPQRTSAYPTGTLPAGTTQSPISLVTNQNATCRYASTAGTAYNAMRTAFATTGGRQHSTPVSGLVGGTRYTYYVRCQGTNGTVNADDFAISFSVAAAPTSTNPPPTQPPSTDATSPTVTIAEPDHGETVTGTVTIQAVANDKAGVTSVTFLVDGTAIGTDTASPYVIRWNTSGVKPGSHTIRAQARDAAGNVGTSRAVTVTVSAASDDDTPTTSGRAVFTPSKPDTGVLRYVLDIFRDGNDRPVATQDLGKPRAADDEISADISRTLASLPDGTYTATVTAVGSAESARSTPSPRFIVKSGRISSGSVSSVAPEGLDPGPEALAVDGHSTEPLRAAGPHETLWVADASTSLVTAFDATTGDLLATIPVGLRPMGIVAPPGVNKVYVADEGSDTVSVISKTTMTVVATIPLPAPFGRQPHHISASPDGRFVYVGERGSNVVDVIDTATDDVSARFATGWPGSKTLAVVPDPSGEILYAVNRGTSPASSTLTALEWSSGSVHWQLPIDDPGHFLLGPDGRTAVLSHDLGGAITFVDLERRIVVNEIRVGAGTAIEGLQLSDSGRYLVVTLGGAPTGVVIVDLTETGSIVPLRAVPSLTAPSATEPLYIPVSGGTEFLPGVLGVDAATQRVVREFRLPGHGTPSAAVLDTRR